ncbi:major capsid protein [Hahella ganghwensis]|uniref:major capsid protein n=1 Tax=Hahella ganghwensis TaxID=286420 RepID=UPI00036D36BD|nr:major capsid protein [Hahella ganghwensis]
MATIDIFNNDAFSVTTMANAFRKVDFLPSMLRNSGIFTPRYIRTKHFYIEEKDGVLSLVKTSKRGEPLEQRDRQKRKARPFETVRLAKGDRITASELADIRAFGSETEVAQVQMEVADRLNGPDGLIRDLELTWENHMLGCIQGSVLDADGTSEIYNWFTEFGVTQDTEIDFDLDNASPASGAIRKKCSQVVRQMMKAAKGAWIPGRTFVRAYCGDNFWDDLTAHPEVRETYLNTQQAADLRDGIAYESFRYGGIEWTNYRGTDDGTTVSVGTDKVKFFPVNAPGVFQMIYSPGETFEMIGKRGQEVYPMIIPDTKRNMYADIEVYSYCTALCSRPKMLQRGRRT